MHALRVFSVVKISILLSIVSALPSSNLNLTKSIIDSNMEAKGIFDGLGGSSTVAPESSGLGGLSGIDQAGGLGPMLIIGGFQALVTKFDPALVAGLPGLNNVPLTGGK